MAAQEAVQEISPHLRDPLSAAEPDKISQHQALSQPLNIMNKGIESRYPACFINELDCRFNK